MKTGILTMNLWADVFGNPVSPRDELAAQIVLGYMPDAVCFQEAHPNWHKSKLFPILKEHGYELSEPDLHGNLLNYTPVMYRTTHWTERDNYFKLYDGLNDYTSKSVSGVLLENNQSGCKIAVMSTHFWFSQDASGNSARCSDAAELIDAYKYFRKRACAVFAGGDYNCTLLDEPFSILANNAVLDASAARCEKINMRQTDHKNPLYDSEAGKYVPALPSSGNNIYSIDHITYSGSAKVTRYEVVCDERSCVVSDHSQVYVEASVGED